MTATSVPQPGAVSALLRWQLRLAHRLLDGTIARLPPELVHQHPPGSAAPAGACYAHAVLSEDLIVNGVLAGGRPLALTTWAGRTGLDELPTFTPSAGSTKHGAPRLRRLPVSGQALSASPGLAVPISRPLAEHSNWRAWSRRVQVELPALRRYAQAVYAATDAHLATLPDAALDPARRELPGCLLNALLLTLATRRGEIAALLAIMGEPASSTTPSSPLSDCCVEPPADR